MSVVSLRNKLRLLIKDETQNSGGIRVSCSDPNSTGATLSIASNVLTTTITGGAAANLSITLTNVSYDTLTELVSYIAAQSGYVCELSPEASADHDSTDLKPLGSVNILLRAQELTTHSWSDTELDDIIEKCTYEHDADLTVATIPGKQENLVLLLARAEISEVLAQEYAAYHPIKSEEFQHEEDGVESSDRYLNLAEYYREEYRIGRARLSGEEKGGGDVNLTHLYKKNMEINVMMPKSLNPAMFTPTLNTPASPGITTLDIDWDRYRHPHLERIELFLATTQAALDKDYSLLDTSNRILSTTDRTKRFFQATSLTSGTPYYAKLYVFDIQNEWAGSAIMTVTTDTA